VAAPLGFPGADGLAEADAPRGAVDALRGAGDAVPSSAALTGRVPPCPTIVPIPTITPPAATTSKRRRATFGPRSGAALK